MADVVLRIACLTNLIEKLLFWEYCDVTMISVNVSGHPCDVLELY